VHPDDKEKHTEKTVFSHALPHSWTNNLFTRPTSNIMSFGLQLDNLPNKGCFRNLHLCRCYRSWKV